MKCQHVTNHVVALHALVHCRVLELLLCGGDVQSAALLTPYNGQVRELQRRFFGNKGLAAYEGMVDISSVDGYQVDLYICSSCVCPHRQHVKA